MFFPFLFLSFATNDFAFEGENSAKSEGLMSSDTGEEVRIIWHEYADSYRCPCALCSGSQGRGGACALRARGKSRTAAIKDADGMWRARRGRGHGLGAGFIRRSAYCWTRLRARARACSRRNNHNLGNAA